MHQRTDPPSDGTAHEFTNEYVITLAGVTLAVLIVVFGIEHGFSATKDFRSVFQVLFAFPWIVAGGITLNNGLVAFSGAEPEVLSGEAYWGPLIPLLVIGVIGVSLFLHLMSGKEFRAEMPPARRLGYLVGLIICTMYFFTLVPVTIIQRSVEGNLRQAQNVQQNKDVVISELSRVAWRVREHGILPEAMGGGDVRSFVVPPNIRNSLQASYFLDWTGDTTVVFAHSRAYAGATARITVFRDGRILSWDFSGRFQ